MLKKTLMNTNFVDLPTAGVLKQASKFISASIPVWENADVRVKHFLDLC